MILGRSMLKKTKWSQLPLRGRKPSRGRLSKRSQIRSLDRSRLLVRSRLQWRKPTVVEDENKAGENEEEDAESAEGRSLEEPVLTTSVDEGDQIQGEDEPTKNGNSYFLMSGLRIISLMSTPELTPIRPLVWSGR
jgi:hypothetical protein